MNQNIARLQTIIDGINFLLFLPVGLKMASSNDIVLEGEGPTKGLVVEEAEMVDDSDHSEEEEMDDDDKDEVRK